MSQSAVPERPRASRSALLRDIGANAVAPYATYLILHGQGIAVVPALAAGAVFPAGAVILGFALRKRIEALGIVVLVATVASIIGAMFFTSPYLLLAKGSLITGGVGTVFLLSLAAHRPLVFYLVSSTGQDQAGRERYMALWETVPPFRLLMRRLTLIWGIALYAEASLRLLLIGLLPIEVFLPVSEAMWIVFFAAMTAWSWRYGARHIQRARDAARA
jgi:hypothetical protein